ncbi:MAG: hypothetical protein M1546_07260 [Chloroflexi bacterium]|nr:hypothetical protein [Chloroflexota bacterium]
MNRRPEHTELTLSQLALCYSLWLVLSAGVIWLMIQTRLNLLDIVLLFRLGPWLLTTIDRFGILFLGVISMGIIVFLEHYLRTGMQRNQFWTRLVRIMFIEAVLLAFSYAFQFGSRVLGTGS